VPDATDEPLEQADQQKLIDLLGPALDRCSAVADQLASLLLEPR
jgi:hypothetical protein